MKVKRVEIELPKTFYALMIENADEARFHNIRLLEALLFASPEPLNQAALAARLGEEADIESLLHDLAQHYAHRGVNLVRIGDTWAFRTASDLAAGLNIEVTQPRKLSRAATETLAIIAYHQPVTRAEIESIRGVATSKGTLDLLMELGWINPGKRRETPGRPLTWLTTDAFLDHFGLGSLRDLPGVEDLRSAGLLDARPVLASLPGLGEVSADRDEEDADRG